MASHAGKRSCRHAFTETLLEAAREDPRIIAVTSDAKGSVTLGDFEKNLPGQFLELGIAEQNAVGVSAGLARSGKKPFVCGPASFYSARCIEQVKNDVAYAGNDVKIIGVSGGVSYGALGSTHHSLHDIAFMRAIPNLTVILPSDNAQTCEITRFLAEHEGPAYMRIGRSPVPDIYDGSSSSFTFGKANILRDGKECTIISTGEAVYHALKAAELLLQENIRVRVLDMPTVKPIDVDAILDAARDTNAIVTVEEHSVYGGLGSAVAEIVSQHRPVQMKIVAFPDEFMPAGSSPELFEHYGLTGLKLAATVSTFLRTRNSVGA